MTYEEIRAVRLQRPFRGLKLRMRNGQEYVIREAEALAITPQNLVFFDADAGIVMSTAEEVESLSFMGDSRKAGV